jgi:hypothetical protein
MTETVPIVPLIEKENEHIPHNHYSRPVSLDQFRLFRFGRGVIQTQDHEDLECRRAMQDTEHDDGKDGDECGSRTSGWKRESGICGRAYEI